MTDSTAPLGPLGILGGGQLGRMTALAAARLGVPVRMLTPDADGPVAPLAHVTVADWTRDTTLAAWAAGCRVVTVESEWAPADRLHALHPSLPVWPAPSTLVVVRHKGRQREVLAQAGLPQPAFATPTSREAAHVGATRLGFPVVAKQFEGSYDGYGNETCRTPDDIDRAWARLAGPDGLLLEAWVPFEAEGAVTVARRPGGETAVYPLVQSEHREHRLHAATVPACVPASAEAEARRVALAAIEAVGAVGVATVELFLMADGQAWVNEIAPRPHNTAHLTIEAHHTSQFENHVRAVLDWPLGTASLRVPAACMINVLGTATGPAAPDLADALAVAGASVHLYGKQDVRPRRKMGHVTACADTPAGARQIAEAAAAAIRW